MVLTAFSNYPLTCFAKKQNSEKTLKFTVIIIQSPRELGKDSQRRVNP